MKITVGGICKKNGHYYSSEALLSYELNEEDLKSSNEELSEKFKEVVVVSQFQRFVSVTKELYKTGAMSDKEMVDRIKDYVKREERANLILESKKFKDVVQKIRDKVNIGVEK